MWEHMGAYGGWGMGFGWIFMPLFLAVMILAIFALVKWLRNEGSTGPGADARRVLDERYARGEIGRDEYNQRREDLSH